MRATTEDPSHTAPRPRRRTGRTLLGAATATLLGATLTLFGTPQPAQAATGLHIRDGRLVEADGNDFVIRGVSHPHAWYPERTDALGHISDKGANAVRVVLSSGHQWTRNDVDDVAAPEPRGRAASGG